MMNCSRIIEYDIKNNNCPKFNRTILKLSSKWRLDLSLFSLKISLAHLIKLFIFIHYILFIQGQRTMNHNFFNSLPDQAKAQLELKTGSQQPQTVVYSQIQLPQLKFKDGISQSASLYRQKLISKLNEL